MTLGGSPVPGPAVRWGFLGAGFVASRALAPAVHDTATSELAAAASRDEDRAAALGPRRAAYGGPDAYERLLADPEVEAVYVSLANDAHRDWTCRALDAGKHVLCEKPLGLTAGDVEAMAAAADRSGRLLVEARWNRWHPRTVRLRELLDSGELGAVREVDARFTFGGVPDGSYRLDPSRGGGALLDVGPYVLDAVLSAAGGATALSVASDVRRGPSGVDLQTDARLVFDNGLAARAVCGIDHPDSQQLVVTTERAVLAPVGSPFTSWREASSLVVRPTDGAPERTETFEPVDAYALMVDAVSRRIRGEEDAWVLPGDESLALARLIDALSDAA